MSVMVDPFVDAVEKHRRELRVHCYRMVASFDEAEDLVQETVVKAWERRDQLTDLGAVRAWLYRIATNTCLDFLRRNERRPRTYAALPGFDHGNGETPELVEWLQPFPDALLEPERPEDEAVARETIELVFLTAIQHLTPQQRAVFVFREVLGWSAADTAAALDVTVATVNSLLQRAKPALRRHLPEDRSTWRTEGPTEEERKVIDAYIAAGESNWREGITDLLTSDAVLTMPPNPFWFSTRQALLDFVLPNLDPSSPTYLGDWCFIPAAANRMPAVAGYVRRPGTTIYRPQVLDVLRVVDGRVAQITTFEPHLFPAFGLPQALS